MQSRDTQKYGQDPRGRRRSVVRSTAEIQLDERYRQRFAQIRTSGGTRPSRAVQEIVEGRQAPWRGNARRVLELMDAQIPTEEIKAVVLGEMDRWIDEQAALRHLRPAA